jgi:hypothetical protein
MVDGGTAGGVGKVQCCRSRGPGARRPTRRAGSPGGPGPRLPTFPTFPTTERAEMVRDGWMPLSPASGVPQAATRKTAEPAAWPFWKVVHRVVVTSVELDARALVPAAQHLLLGTPTSMPTQDQTLEMPAGTSDRWVL